MSLVGTVGMGFGFGVVATWLALLASRRLGMLAQPNHRSSHSEPTPTSGGVGFVLMILGWSAFHLDQPMAWVVLGGGGVLAVVSLIDDLKHLSPAVRLPVQIMTAVAALLYLELGEVRLGETLVSGPLFLVGAGFIGVWLINLYNFMDGIDGLAAVQFVVFGAGAIALGAGDGFPAELSGWASATVLGFLLFNWAPARLFMGDVGSAVLGFLVWLLALTLDATGQVPLVASLVLLTVFWFDASYTLSIRILTGQAFTSAHRSHLYQHLARRLGHGWTTLLFVGFSAVWLFPLSVATRDRPEWWWVWIGLACAPLVFGCTIVGAGLAERPEVSESESESERGE